MARRNETELNKFSESATNKVVDLVAKAVSNAEVCVIRLDKNDLPKTSFKEDVALFDILTQIQNDLLEKSTQTLFDKINAAITAVAVEYISSKEFSTAIRNEVKKELLSLTLSQLGIRKDSWNRPDYDRLADSPLGQIIRSRVKDQSELLKLWLSEEEINNVIQSMPKSAVNEVKKSLANCLARFSDECRRSAYSEASEKYASIVINKALQELSAIDLATKFVERAGK